MAIPLFYSYSHRDESFRESLETHLAILKRQGFIEEWHDRRIDPGSNWAEEINLNLQNAKITLLLVSSNFLASDYCYETETIFALEQHENKECIVIPIIIRPCLWKHSNFKHLQVLPKDGKAITTWDNEDEAWLNVAEGILKVIEDINGPNSPLNSKDGDQFEISNEALQNYSAPDSESRNLDTIEESTVVYDDGNDALNDLLLEFLDDYSRWYFSPLRIQKWGGKQSSYAELKNHDSSEIREHLEQLTNKGLLKTTTSQKGNKIYKFVGNKIDGGGL